MKLIKGLFPPFWMLFILVICLIPGQDLPKITFWDNVGIDKIAHCTVFAILAFSLFLAQKNKNYSFLTRYKSPFYVVIFCGLYGFLIEIMQGAFVYSRNFDIFDGVANLIGAFMGWGVWHVYSKRRLKLIK